MTTPGLELVKSAYEIAREERLRMNRAALEELDLVPTPVAAAMAAHEVSKPAPRTKRPRQQAVEPLRRSSRLVPQDTNGELHEGLEAYAPAEPMADERAHRHESRDAAMEAKIRRLRELLAERGETYDNPTATYEHTWMRVRTMSDAALALRVRAIERALGRHCIVKMRMFTEVLALAGKSELAEEARAALDRLLILGGSTTMAGPDESDANASAPPPAATSTTRF